MWLYDHLAGSVHGAPHVLECWTVLSALAAAVPRLTLGSLVLNVANRDAGTLAVMAATLQEVSGGRLLLGVGAGGGAGTPYAAEQRGARPRRPVRRGPQSRPSRRPSARSVGCGPAPWAGPVVSCAPDPSPPVIVGGFGPKMAELAGRLGDGINAPGGPSLAPLIDVARQAHAARRDATPTDSSSRRPARPPTSVSSASASIA